MNSAMSVSTLTSMAASVQSSRLESALTVGDDFSSLVAAAGQIVDYVKSFTTLTSLTSLMIGLTAFMNVSLSSRHCQVLGLFQTNQDHRSALNWPCAAHSSTDSLSKGAGQGITTLTGLI